MLPFQGGNIFWALFTQGVALGWFVAAPSGQVNVPLFVLMLFIASPTLNLTKPLNRQRLKQLIHLPVAIGKGIEVDAHFIEQGQMQVGQRGRLRVLEVAIAFHAEGRAARDEDRQVRVVVDVGIADATAVKNQGVVEQCAGPVLRRLQFREVLREE